MLHRGYLGGVVVEEACWGEQDKAVDMVGAPLAQAGDQVDQQGCTAKAVTYCPQPVGLWAVRPSLLPLTVHHPSFCCRIPCPVTLPYCESQA